MERQATEQEIARAHELIGEIFSEKYHTLTRYAKTAIYGASQGDLGRAEELVQEAMVIALDKPLDFIYSDNPLGWLINTIRNIARNAIRADQRMTKLLMEYRNLSNTEARDSYDIQLLFYGLVPPEDLRLLEQVYLDGYRYRDLQEELNLTPSALAMRIKRAKAKFIKNYILSSEKYDTDEHNKIGGVQSANEE